MLDVNQMYEPRESVIPEYKEIIASSQVFLMMPDPLGTRGRQREGTRVSLDWYSSSNRRF